MSAGKRLTLEEVKYFIEVESNSGCKLLSEEYVNVFTNLIIQCKCGNIFSKSYNDFKNKLHCCQMCSNKSRIFKNSLSNENVKNIIKELGYKLISDYINSKTKLIIEDSNGYLYFLVFHNLIKNKKSNAFDKSNPYTLHNIKLWCKLNNKPFELISEVYEGDKKKLKWKCFKNNCGEIFEMNWDSVKSGQGCSVCRGRQIKLSNCLFTKNLELANEWHPTKNGDLTPYDVICGSTKKVWWICKECGHEWSAIIRSRANNNNGCPQCNKSKGEKIIKEWSDNIGFIIILQDEYDKLDDFNKKLNNYYISQKEFSELKGLGNRNLSYDFYYPNYNLLVEYQGEQHDHPVDFKNKGKNYAEKEFLKQLEHDKRKREYAINNNINLLEIWYWDFNNIERILDECFNKTY